MGMSMQDCDDLDTCLAGLAAFRDLTMALGPLLAPYASQALEILGALLRMGDRLDARLRPPALACLGDIVLAVGTPASYLSIVMGLFSEEVASTRSDCPVVLDLDARDARSDQTMFGCAPYNGAGANASCVGGAGILKRCRTAPLPARMEGERASRRAALDAVLEGYEAVVRGCRRSGVLSQVREFLPDVLNFACHHAGAQGTSPGVLRPAVRLIGALADEFPTEFSAFLCADAEARAGAAKLASFGAACPNKAVRELASSISPLLPVQENSLSGGVREPSFGSCVVSLGGLADVVT